MVRNDALQKHAHRKLPIPMPERNLHGIGTMQRERAGAPGIRACRPGENMIKKLQIVLLPILLVLLCRECPGAMLRHINLEAMCRRAESVFTGVCIEKQMVYDEAAEAAVIHYTFRTHRVFKGPQADRVTFKMHPVATRFARAPSFTRGDDIIVFLYAKSPQGFTSPVGFGQGTFHVTRTAGGKRTVANAHNNRRLFAGMATEEYTARSSGLKRLADAEQFTAHRSGPVSYALFIALIEAVLD